MTNLQTLYLSQNQLTEIPIELSLLTNLQRLDLDNNQLTEISKKVLDMNCYITINAKEIILEIYY